jgi:hypothetical protein
MAGSWLKWYSTSKLEALCANPNTMNKQANEKTHMLERDVQSKLPLQEIRKRRVN